MFTLARQGAALELGGPAADRFSPADFLPDGQSQQQRSSSEPEPAFAHRVAGAPAAAGGGMLALPQASAVLCRHS